MPGAIPHLFAGFVMFGVGLLVFNIYLKGRGREKLYLLLICLLFSCIPDFFLVLYYLFGLFSRDVLMPYHVLFHSVFTPVFLVILVLLFVVDVKRKPIWIMGCLCVLLHVGMDMVIHEGGLWI